MNEDRLSKRRVELARKIITAKIYLLITMLVTVVDLIGMLTDIRWLILPYGLYMPQFALSLGFDFGVTENAVRPGAIALSAAVVLGFMAFYLIAFFMISKSAKWATALYYMFVLDAVVLAVSLLIAFLPAFAPLMTNVAHTLIVNLINLAIHVYAAIWFRSAMIAARGLDILPEQEIDDGDPYEEFRNKE